MVRVIAKTSSAVTVSFVYLSISPALLLEAWVQSISPILSAFCSLIHSVRAISRAPEEKGLTIRAAGLYQRRSQGPTGTSLKGVGRVSEAASQIPHVACRKPCCSSLALNFASSFHGPLPYFVVDLIPTPPAIKVTFHRWPLTPYLSYVRTCSHSVPQLLSFALHLDTRSLT